MDKNNFLDEIRSVMNSLIDYVASEYPESDINLRISIDIEPLLSVDKPKIMVYGIYNSGKSTLINALCKKAVAETGDRPMTATVTSYDNGDYYLIDSPGVDAPIEHEQLTEAHLNKCHIILFVMSTKGIFEDQSNYKRMAELIERKIPFVIVLNEKGGYATSPDDSPQERQAKRAQYEVEMMRLQHKVIENLQKVSGDPSICTKYETIRLNAKRALDGVLKDKATLYEKSNITELEKRIHQILQSTNSLSVFSQPINNLLTIIAEIEAQLIKDQSGLADIDFDGRLNTLFVKKKNLINDLKIYIRDIVYHYTDEMTRAIVNEDSSAFDAIKDSILDEIRECFILNCEPLMHYINTKFKEIGIVVDQRIELGTPDYSEDRNSNSTYWTMPSVERMQFKTYESQASPTPENKDLLSIVLDIFSSPKKKEEKKLKRLNEEVDIANRNAAAKLNEDIRVCQESRKKALSQLAVLHTNIMDLVNNVLDEKFLDLTNEIKHHSAINDEKSRYLDMKLQELHAMQRRLTRLSNEI